MTISNYVIKVSQTVLKKQTGQSVLNFKSIESDSVQNMRSRASEIVSTNINSIKFILKTKKSTSTVPVDRMCLIIIDDQLVSGL